MATEQQQGEDRSGTMGQQQQQQQQQGEDDTQPAPTTVSLCLHGGLWVLTVTTRTLMMGWSMTTAGDNDNKRCVH
jgi:hypothetical protein